MWIDKQRVVGQGIYRFCNHAVNTIVHGIHLKLEFETSIKVWRLLQQPAILVHTTLLYLRIAAFLWPNPCLVDMFNCISSCCQLQSLFIFLNWSAPCLCHGQSTPPAIHIRQVWPFSCVSGVYFLGFSISKSAVEYFVEPQLGVRRINRSHLTLAVVKNTKKESWGYVSLGEFISLDMEVGAYV